VAGAAELEDLVAFKNALDQAAQTRPELNLACDGALHGVACQAGVEDESVG
jgi:hypothetical protein